MTSQEPERPAMEGGRPVRDKFLSYVRHWVGQEEIDEIVDTLRSDWITQGPKVVEFEKQMARYLGCRHVVAVTSCTAALHLSHLACGIQPGDEVIVPDLTFAATPSAPLMVGAKPVLADVNRDTYDLSVTDAAKRITPKTRALLPMHYGGQPCDMDEISALANKHSLHVIADAAHAVGAEYHGRKISSFGDAACFSLHATKNMTTAEGGLIATDSDEIDEKARILRAHGFKGSHVVTLGYKYAMNELQASLGLAQLKKLDGFLRTRDAYAKRYLDEFADLSTLELPRIKSRVRHTWHLFAPQLRIEALRITRDEFRERLKAENIGTQVHFPPVHSHPYYQSLGYSSDFPQTNHLAERILTLPLYPKMQPQDLDDVVHAVRKTLAYYRRPSAPPSPT